jgi:uncharacterized membrane protein YhaH (DUF805 family)
MVGYIGLAIIDSALDMYNVKAEMGLLSGIFSLLMLLPSISVACRRLHDIGKSGWWQLIAIIPLGIFLLVAFLCRAGQKGPNRYGANPKEADLTQQ